MPNVAQIRKSKKCLYFDASDAVDYLVLGLYPLRVSDSKRTSYLQIDLN